MARTLQGKNVAVLAADGAERIELEMSRDAVQQESAHTLLLSVKSCEIHAMNHGIDTGANVRSLLR
jgi:hypothetical protein